MWRCELCQTSWKRIALPRNDRFLKTRNETEQKIERKRWRKIVWGEEEGNLCNSIRSNFVFVSFLLLCRFEKTKTFDEQMIGARMPHACLYSPCGQLNQFQPTAPIRCFFRLLLNVIAPNEWHGTKKKKTQQFSADFYIALNSKEN